jgi:predicted acyl esterase
MQHLYDIHVRVPMRDGVALAANVWHPADGPDHPSRLVLPIIDRKDQR